MVVASPFLLFPAIVAACCCCFPPPRRCCLAVDDDDDNAFMTFCALVLTIVRKVCVCTSFAICAAVGSLLVVIPRRAFLADLFRAVRVPMARSSTLDRERAFIISSNIYVCVYIYKKEEMTMVCEKWGMDRNVV